VASGTGSGLGAGTGVGSGGRLGTGSGGAVIAGGAGSCKPWMRAEDEFRKPRPGWVGIEPMLLMRSLACLNQRSAE
jgi:hypothetical protein